MSLTIDESGKALTETIQGITMPVDCSFDSVNNFVHGDPCFEELQSLCLILAVEIEKLGVAASFPNKKGTLYGCLGYGNEERGLLRK